MRPTFRGWRGVFWVAALWGLVFLLFQSTRSDDRATSPLSPSTTTDAANGEPVVFERTLSGDRAGLALVARIGTTSRSLVVDTTVTNGRSGPAYLDVDGCGLVTGVYLRPTAALPEGKRWSGSIGAAKQLLVERQRESQRPDPFRRRIPGDLYGREPECVEPLVPRKLAAGAVIAERWELPFADARRLRDGGSKGTSLHVELREAKGPGPISRYAGTYPFDELGGPRALQLDEPTSAIVDRAATEPPGPSSASTFDRLLANGELRRWVEAQPARSWQFASVDGEGTLKLVTSRYDRPAVATATSVDLPSESDRARPFTTRAATLPAGIREIPERHGYDRVADVVTGSVNLPSGRIVVSEYFGDWWSAPFRVAPGAYRTFLTTAQQTRWNFPPVVALATLELSQRPTVRWKQQGGWGADGGMGAFASVEAAKRMTREWADVDSFLDRLEDSETAHGGLGTNMPLTDDLDVVYFNTGEGDGGYPIYIGYDAAGQPTRIVLDFGILHLKWPGATS